MTFVGLVYLALAVWSAQDAHQAHRDGDWREALHLGAVMVALAVVGLILIGAANDPT